MPSIHKDIENFEKALSMPEKSYTLFCGYCYIEIIIPKLNLANITGINCHRHFLYSCLSPDCIFVPTAWMHTLTIARNFEKHLVRINKIINELVNTGAPMLVVEAPAAMQRYVHDTDKKGVTNEQILERRELYYEKVIKPGNFLYLDLNRVISGDSNLIKENSNDEYNSAPWHVNEPVYEIFCEIFVNWRTKNIVEIPNSLESTIKGII